MDRQPHGVGEAALHEAAPGVAALDRLVGQLLAPAPQLGAAELRAQRRQVLEKEAMDAVEQRAAGLVAPAALADAVEAVAVLEDQHAAQLVEAAVARHGF